MYPKHMGRLSAVCLCILLAMQLTACSADVNTVENTESSSDTEISSDTETSSDTEASLTEEVTETEHTETSAEVTEVTAESVSSGEEQLNNIMGSMNDTDYLAAICFIGYAEGETDDVIDVCCENYPVAALIPQERWAIADGDELYCIIPADDSVTVAVNEYVWDADLNGGVGDELCRSENGEPVLLRGNISAGLQNLEAVVTRGDVSVAFSPCMDIYEHKIELYSDYLPYIMDATDYSKELPTKLNGIKTFGVPSEEVKELVSQNIDKGMFFPFETELVECSWSVTADSDWVMEFFAYDNYYPYTGYIKIYKMLEEDENLYEGCWAIEDGCLALYMNNFIGDQINTIHDAFPILVQYDDTGMSMIIFKGNDGTLLPFMVSGEIYAELSQTLG